MPKEVFLSELDSLIASGALLVDVREQEEVAAQSGLPGHLNLPLSKLGELAAAISKERPTIFYCLSGSRSFQAAEIAARWTSQPVYYLSGGLRSYIDT